MFPNEFFGTQYLTAWADYCLNLDVLTCWVEAGVDANPDDELADEYAQEWGLVSWEDAELALVQLEHKKWAGQSESILILYSRLGDFGKLLATNFVTKYHTYLATL